LHELGHVRGGHLDIAVDAGLALGLHESMKSWPATARVPLSVIECDADMYGATHWGSVVADGIFGEQLVERFKWKHIGPQDAVLVHMCVAADLLFRLLTDTPPTTSPIELQEYPHSSVRATMWSMAPISFRKERGRWDAKSRQIVAAAASDVDAHWSHFELGPPGRPLAVEWDTEISRQVQELLVLHQRYWSVLESVSRVRPTWRRKPDQSPLMGI
jgi:hypothetical protein